EAADALVKKAEAAVKAEEAKLEAVEAKAANITLSEKLAERDVADKELLADKAQLALDECLVTAPEDGKVLRLGLHPRDLLPAQPAHPPLIFCPARPRIIRAEIEQEWVGRVQDGQIATIQDETGNGTGPVWKGKVVRTADWLAQRRLILPDPSAFHDVRTLE